MLQGSVQGVIMAVALQRGSMCIACSELWGGITELLARDFTSSFVTGVICREWPRAVILSACDISVGVWCVPSVGISPGGTAPCAQHRP